MSSISLALYISTSTKSQADVARETGLAKQTISDLVARGKRVKVEYDIDGITKIQTEKVVYERQVAKS